MRNTFRQLTLASGIPSLALAVFAAGFALISAFRLRWTCDDAFISFRYAKNLTEGLGLVFNAGEVVEGYTNFLWTILMALGIFLKLDPRVFAEGLGLVFYAGVLYLLYAFGRRLNEKGGGGARVLVFFPLALAGYALIRHARIYASGGLETSLFTFLILLGTYLVYLRAHANRSLFPGAPFLVFALAAMTRPDGLLFYATAGLYLLMRRDGPGSLGGRGESLVVRARKILLEHWPLLVVFLPYFLWRYSYYGYVFPNTYYAKSGGASHFAQGWKYFTLFFNAYYVFYFLPPLLIAYAIRKAREGRRAFFKGSDPFVFFLLLPTAVAGILYYVKVGGGFMFGRFFMPFLPFLFLTMEYATLRLFRPRLALAATLIVMFAAMAYNDPYRGRPLPARHGISDESKIYRPRDLSFLSAKVRSWSRAFRESGAKIAFGGSQAFYAYYLNVPTAIEAASGLTDAYLAHRPLPKRGAIMGHEKSAPLSYLKRRGVHIHLHPGALPGRRPYNVMKVAGLPGEWRVITYRSSVMNRLAQVPDFQFRRFESYLDDYIARLHSIPREKVRRDYAEFRAYYFRWNRDESRERKILKRMREVR